MSLFSVFLLDAQRKFTVKCRIDAAIVFIILKKTPSSSPAVKNMSIFNAAMLSQKIQFYGRNASINRR